MPNRQVFVYALFIYVLLLSVFNNTEVCIVLGALETELAENVSFTYSVSIDVNSIDFSKKRASLSIRLTIYECTHPNATAITFTFEHDANIFVKCIRVSEGFYYGTTSIDWPLFGKGESYPFDSYELRFVISRQFYFEVDNQNYLMIPDVVFRRDWSSLNIKMDETSSEVYINEFHIDVNRSSLLPFYQLLLPILLCYFMLGGSLFIERSRLDLRLRVYLSLFVLAPSLLFAIQSYLPYRTSLCIPEILLISVLTSTAIFSFFSMISRNSTETKARILDHVAIGTSIGMLSFLYWPILSSVVSFQIIAIFLIAILGSLMGTIMRLLTLAIRRVTRTSI